jgi:hypothetical protein
MESFGNIGNTKVFLLNRKSSLSMIHNVIEEMKHPRQHVLCFISPFFEGIPLFETIDLMIDTGISFSHKDHVTLETTISKKENIQQRQNVHWNHSSLESYFLLFPESTYQKTNHSRAPCPDLPYLYLQCKYHHIPFLLSRKEIQQCHQEFFEFNIRPETLYSVDIYHLLYNTEGIPLHILSMIRFLHRNSHLYHDSSFLLFVCIMTLFFFQKNDGPPLDLSQNPYFISCFSIRTEFALELEEMFLWVTLFLNFFISPHPFEFCHTFSLDILKMNQFQRMVFKLFNNWVYRIPSSSIPHMNFLLPSEKSDSKITHRIHPDYREHVRFFFYKQSQFEIVPLYNMIVDKCVYSIHFKNITNPHLMKTFLQKDCVPRFLLNLSCKKEICDWRHYDKSVISLFVFTPLYHLKLFQDLKVHISSFLDRTRKRHKKRLEFHHSVIQYIQKVMSKAPDMVDDTVFLS